MVCFTFYDELLSKIQLKNKETVYCCRVNSCMDQSEHGASPLLDIVMARVLSSSQTLSQVQEATLRQAFTDFILGGIDYSKALSIVMPILNSAEILEYTNTILTTPEKPLPNYDENESDSKPNNARKRTRSWTQAEDRRLIAGIQKFGIDNWANVAAFIGNGRTRAQCSQRWNRGLDPRISKDQWTKEEDEKLINLVRLKGNQGWTVIASEMGNRSDVQCRYHYKQMQLDSQFYGFPGLPAHIPSGPGDIRTSHSSYQFQMNSLLMMPPQPISMNNPMNNSMFNSPMNGPMNPSMNGPMNPSINPPMNGQMNPSMNGPMNHSMNGMENSMNSSMNSSPMNNGMNNPMNNGMGNGMNNPMNGSMNNPMNNPMNPGMNNPMNSGMNNPMNPGMNNPMNPGMNNPMNSGMNNPMNPGMNNPMNPGMNNPMNPGMNNPMNPGMNNPMNPGMNNPMNSNMNNPMNQQMAQQRRIQMAHNQMNNQMNGQLGSMSSMNASMNTPMNNPMNAQMSSPMGQPLGQPLPPQMGMQGQMPMSLFAGKPMSASTPNLFNPQMQLGSTGMNNPKLMPRQKRGRRKKQMFPGADEDQDDISNSALGIETPSLTTIEMNESATHGESDDAGTENKPEKEKINDTENDIFMSFSDYVDW